MAFATIHRMVDWVGTIPGLLQLRRSIFARRFRGSMGHAFHGVFDSFESARGHVPPNLPPSYDNPASAAMYEDRLAVDDHDYPALFWLQHALDAGLRAIVDLGGSTGIKFYAFEPLLTLPEDARWLVVETPAAVKLGREIATRRSVESRLAFTAETGDADGCDVLFASGSLQYLPRSLAEILAGFGRPPRRILVNTTPIHASRSYFTLNNIGSACCPYRVVAHDEFLRGVEARGYRLRAEWRNPSKTLDLPYEPGLGLDHYMGFCFDRVDSPS